MGSPSLSPDSILELIEDIWLPLNPDLRVDWRVVLAEMDLEVAERTAIVLREAHPTRPSLGLYRATYNGLMRDRRKNPRQFSMQGWFEEQRAKLRPVESHPEQS